MQRKEFEKNWNQLKDDIQNQWSKLTTEDVNEIDGMFDRLVNCLATNYGYSRDTALRQIENWEPNLEREESSAGEFQPRVSQQHEPKIHEFKQTPARHEKQHPAHPHPQQQQKKRKAV